MDSVGGPPNGITGRIDLTSSDQIPDLTDQIHQLPCCIKHDGPCPVCHYFKPKTTGVVVDGLEVAEASFRGRKLQGLTIPLPEGYCGYVLEKKNLGKGTDLDTSEENSNCWEARAKFQSITYWNHDNLPSNDDAFLRCFHWFSVANALHKPVTADDLASPSNEECK